MNKNPKNDVAGAMSVSNLNLHSGQLQTVATRSVNDTAANASYVDEMVFDVSNGRPAKAGISPTTPTTSSAVSITEELTTIDQMVAAIESAGKNENTGAQGEKDARFDVASFIAQDQVKDQSMDDERMDFSPGEVGHAERFVEVWSHCTRYDASRGVWMLWRETHWEPDEAGEVLFRMILVARKILREEVFMLRQCSTEYADRYSAMAKKVHEEGLKLHYLRSIACSLQIARVLPGMATKARQYDADPMAFNCENGTIDLRTGLLAPHRADGLHTKISPVRFGAPEEQCPRWMQFLREITCDDEELVAYFQRVVGYILTGSTTEQCFFLFYGMGANGKSTFINVLKHLLGAYGEQTDFTTFMDMNRGASPRNDLAKLVGKRLVVSPEGGEGKSLDEPVVKQFTGGDAMTVRFLNKEFFEFQPVGKIVLATNHRPVVKGTDHGIWRRMRLVPFLATFDTAKADADLTEKLIAEAPAILRWAVEGTQLWLKQGLGIPAAVSAATMNYRSSMDIFQTFFEERCTVEFSAMAGSQALYDSYTDWCVTAGIRVPMKQSVFNQRLEERGFVRKKTATQNVWMGVGLKSLTAGLCPGAHLQSNAPSMRSGNSYGDLNFST